MKQAEVGKIYTFDHIPFEIRGDSDPYIVVTKTGYNLGFNLQIFAFLSSLFFYVAIFGLISFLFIFIYLNVKKRLGSESAVAGKHHEQVDEA
jgi:hypothetical protein